jgi:hypothetical protein
MKKYLTMMMLAAWSAAAVPFQVIDLTTPGTNASYSAAFATIHTNAFPFTNSWIELYNMTNRTKGDLTPIAWGKVNANFWAISNWISTNIFAIGSQTPWLTDIDADTNSLTNLLAIVFTVPTSGQIGTVAPSAAGVGMFISGRTNTLSGNYGDAPVFALGGVFNEIEGADDSGLIGGNGNYIVAGGGTPSYGDYIIAGQSNSIYQPGGGHIDHSMILNGNGINIRTAGVTVIGDRGFSDNNLVPGSQTNQFIFSTPEMLAIREVNGVAINTNTPGPTTNGLNVNGYVNAAGFMIDGTNIAVGGGAGGGIATSHGYGNDLTLTGSNNISGVSIYATTAIYTNELYVSGADPRVVGLNGYYVWCGSCSEPDFTNGYYAPPGPHGGPWYQIAQGTNGVFYICQGSIFGPVFPGAYFYSNSAALIGTYTMNPDPAYTNALYGVTNITIGWWHAPYVTNTVLQINDVGPNGGKILFPGGTELVGQSLSNTQYTNDCGLLVGNGNGQLLGEKFSVVFGATNDISGGEFPWTIVPNPQIIGASIMGGVDNTIGANDGTGNYAFIAGGLSNLVTGDFSYASGHLVLNTNQDTFVWNDGFDDGSGGLSSYADNQFLIHASNGVAINTNAGTSALNVGGMVSALGFAGGGAVGGSAAVAIQTNSVGPHGWTLCFTNGLFIQALRY